MPDLVECQRCHEPVPTEQLLEHLRLLHPDVDAEPGDTVATDLTDPTEAYKAAAAATEGHQIRLGWGSWSCRCGAEGEGDEARGPGYWHLLSLELGAASPILEAATRAKVAAEIRGAKPDLELKNGHPFGADEPLITLDRAAKIAEGSTDGR
jgi:hypothetical protein